MHLNFGAWLHTLLNYSQIIDPSHIVIPYLFTQ